MDRTITLDGISVFLRPKASMSRKQPTKVMAPIVTVINLRRTSWAANVSISMFDETQTLTL
jgi:hypothetical protein